MDTIVENNTRKFYASIGKIILGVLVTAILVGLIFWLFIDILSDFTNFYSFFYLQIENTYMLFYRLFDSCYCTNFKVYILLLFQMKKYV